MADADARIEATKSRPRLRLPDHVPDLRGKWLTLYTIVWTAALVLAIVASTRALERMSRWVNQPAWSNYGLITTQNASGVHIDNVFSDEARRAGVRPGDLVVAINGAPVTAWSEDDRARLRAVRSSDFTLRAGNRSIRRVHLTNSSENLAQRYRGTGINRSAEIASILVSNALTPAVLVPAAILLFIRRRREAVPALLSLGFLLVAGSDFIVRGSDVGLSDMVMNLIASFGWASLISALLTFPSGRFDPRWTAMATAASVLIAALAFAPTGSIPSWSSALLIGILLLLSAAALIGRYRRLEPGAERQQLRVAFFGFFIGIVMLILAVTITVLSPSLVAIDPRWDAWFGTFMPPIVAGSLPVMAIGLMISIFRYRLYDADAVIGRSAAYGVLTLGFVGLFAGGEKLAELVGERYFEHSIGIAAGAVGAAVAAICIVPLHNRVHRWAERRFQKALVRLRHGLPDCVADLRESASVKQLVAAVLGRIESGVRSRCEAVLLVEKGKLAVAGARGVSAKSVREWQLGSKPAPGERPFDCDRHDQLFPLRVRLCVETGDEPETIGWLLLGPRPDGSMFGKDEREALAEIAGPVARAIHIAQLREKRDAEAEKRLSALEALIDKIASAIKGGPAAATA